MANISLGMRFRAILIWLLSIPSFAAAKDPCAECLERLERLEQSCTKGKASACASLGAELHLLKESKRAVAALMRGCELGELDACYNAATSLVRGEADVPADPERAFQLFESVCAKRRAKNAANACVNLANLYADGPGSRRDEAKAVDLFVQACKAGNHTGCNNAGNHYSTGRGVPKDVGREVYYRELGCKGNAKSCFNLGVLYERNPELKNVPKAMDYYLRACSMKNGKGCMNAAVIYERGRGMKEDALLARKYYELGCEYGAAEACFNLGYMLAEGRQVPMDVDKAYLYFARACDGGDDYGCRAMAARRRDPR